MNVFFQVQVHRTISSLISNLKFSVIRCNDAWHAAKKEVWKVAEFVFNFPISHNSSKFFQFEQIHSKCYVISAYTLENASARRVANQCHNGVFKEKRSEPAFDKKNSSFRFFQFLAHFELFRFSTLENAFSFSSVYLDELPSMILFGLFSDLCWSRRVEQTRDNTLLCECSIFSVLHGTYKYFTFFFLFENWLLHFFLSKSVVPTETISCLS